MPTTSSPKAKLNSSDIHTGRIVTILSVILGVIGAATPVIANMDLSSTAGVAAGIVALSAVVSRYLHGCQLFEARLDAHQLSPPASASAATQQASAPIVAAMTTNTDEATPAPERAREAHPSADTAQAITFAVDLAMPPGDVGELVEDDRWDEPADIPQPPVDDEIDAVILDCRAVGIMSADGTRTDSVPGLDSLTGR